jgi:multidrug/hemolysin transport system permease protein
MNAAGMIVSRNIKLFFRDKASVFFSMMAIIIIIMLYALFLGNIQVQEITRATGMDADTAGWLVNSWILAGTLSVSTITVSLGAYGTMVEDVSRGRVKDFFVAPLKRGQLVAGYMVASALISAIMNVIAFIISEAYIVASGGELLSPIEMLEVLGILLLSIFAFSSFVCFITSFIKSVNAFAALSTIVGTLIGFLTGIYVPVGVLPEAIVTFMKFLPFTYTALWLREIFTAAPMAQVFTGPAAPAGEQYAVSQGIYMYFGDSRVEPWMMAIIIAASGVLFFLLSLWRLSKRSWIAK